MNKAALFPVGRACACLEHYDVNVAARRLSQQGKGLRDPGDSFHVAGGTTCTSFGEPYIGNMVALGMANLPLPKMT